MSTNAKLVVFDCDGVLVDSEAIACRIEAEELTRIGYPITFEEDIKRFAGKSQKAILETVENALQKKIPDDFNINLNAKILKALSEDLLSISGIEEALLNIQYKCIASSGQFEKIFNSLRVTKLDSFFETSQVFSASMVKNGKPEPDLFLYSAQQMGFSPENCVVIEDSLYGVQAGVKAGMTVFGFVGGSHILDAEHGLLLKDAGASLVFDDMKKLPYLLDGGEHDK